MQEIHNVTTYHRRFTSYTNLLSSKDRSRHHARPPEHYAELFDTNLNNLFSGRMLNIGDPNLAVDLPNVFTIDVMYKPTTYKQSHPSIALFPHTPFLTGSFNKIIDYNGITKSIFAHLNRKGQRPKREFLYMKEAINYQSQISECFFETLRLLKTGGEAFFGSLHHLRIQDQHDQRFWLFERIVNAFDELGITDSDIYDNPHDERTNKYNNPLVSRLRLTKLRELTAQDQENLQNILDVSKYALPPNFMKWFDEPFDWKKFSEANII